MRKPIDPRVKSIFSYDGKTGIITRDGRRVGSNAKDGYLRVCAFGTSYAYHRLAFFLFHGEVPEYVDHANCDRRDNRIENLRAATAAQNSFNRRNVSTRFPKGVTLHKKTGKYQAQIALAGTNHYLGLFENVELAHGAYCEAVVRLHGDFARSS